MGLQWDTTLAVGHEMIDEQHRELFARFNAFLEACNQRHGKSRLEELFRFLDTYVVEHFRAEEELMQATAYPEADEHLSQHRHFIDRVRELRDELDRDGPTLPVIIQTNKALLYWLTSHIRQVDTALARWLEKS
ncbi:hemerythrin [Geothermobacter ehrlichii]|uniref:Hemerythrin n=1 Tax=Geothermobacter ehrlichii TaxID=213224 RepID=A0A5D3WQ09_9BACT|nr:hemerythrin family protein [Geothermobacter ehrlichii]TYO99889.1 hemerythrin [Geothermobacter ehrlichii]